MSGEDDWLEAAYEDRFLADDDIPEYYDEEEDDDEDDDEF